MRPLRIKISAFGPYAGEIDLNMAELGTNGLYLITGDTGAGKTTIFDAISFALFGEASGIVRGNETLRSKYADPYTPTFVELEFSYRGDVFVVRRNPEYLRPKAKTDGFTTATANATLTFPDKYNRAPITKASDVTKEIESLLGLNRGQFSQIAMIAQGDFLKLILSSTKERIEIFRKIFDTDKYRELQDRLSNELIKIKKDYIDNEKSISNLIEGLISDDDNIDANKLLEELKVKSNIMEVNNIIDIIDNVISYDTNKIGDISSQISEKSIKLNEISAKIGKTEQYYATKEKIDYNNKILSEKTPEFEECKKIYADADAKKSEIEQLAIKINIIGEELKNYDEMSLLSTKNKETNNNINDNSAKLHEIDENISKTIDIIDKNEEALSKFKNIDTDNIIYTQEKDVILKLYNESTDLWYKLKEYENAKKELQSVQNRYQTASNIEKNAYYDYESKRRAFMDGQAGILACNLNDGDECPVCGATHHPNLAKISSNIPTEDELERYEKKYKEEQHKTMNLNAEAAKYNQNVINLEKNLVESANKLLGQCAISEIKDLLTTKGQEYKKRLDDVQNKIQEIEKASNMKQNLTNIIDNDKNTLNQFQNTKNSLINDKTRLETEHQSIATQIDKVKQKLKFTDKSQAINEIEKLQEDKKYKEKVLNDAKNTYENLKKQIDEAKTAIKTLTEQLATGEDINLDLLNSDLTIITNEINRLNDIKTDIVSRSNINIKIKTKLTKEFDNLSKLKSMLAIVNSLSDTANGKLSNKDKVMLETYILMNYFDSVISRANVRLMIMTSGQYELKRRIVSENRQGQSGLDLNVVDHYNGSERNITSLSGGESFMASLCLALGMSDTIQSELGGIQLDTMFIDEGFGSLDEEALNQALRALKSVTDNNRLIGIISHVEDLKTRIDKQIIVTKNKFGGSNVKIVV